MIGQEKLLHKIDNIIQSYPKFSILVGPKGSGKTLIAKDICHRLKLSTVFFGTSIQEVRDIIDLSYQQTEPICYICKDADTMSLGAKNCLLKITEEPPNNAYFILTLQSINNTLGTLQSRGTVLTLDDYTKEELISYRKLKDYNGAYDYIINDVCTNTGEVDELFANKVEDFYKFAQNITNNIHIPTTGNIFKIAKSIKSGQSGEGYDAILLFKTVRNLFIKKALETKKPQYLEASNVTSNCLRDLQLQILNVTGTVDKWVMDVRVALRGI